MTPSRRLLFVDVLRGLAIITVMVHHLPPAFGQVFGLLQVFGGRGVDLFFVLSGFLIGSTCLSRAELGRSPKAQFGAYWVLRSARIWPLYLAMLAIVVLGVPGVDTEATRIVRGYPQYYLFFFSNDLPQATLELGVLWSLAIEEQFYLAVGLVLPLASRSRAQLAGAFAAMGIVAILVSVRTRFDLVTLHQGHVFDDGLFIYRTYHSTMARLDQLGLGLLAAVLVERFNALRVARSPSAARATTWAAVAATLAAMIWVPQFGPLEFVVVGLVFALSVLWAQRPAARSLELGRMEVVVLEGLGRIGQLSFGLYLIHPFVRHGLLAVMKRLELPFTPQLAAAFLACWVALSVVTASASYRWFETPILRRARGLADGMLAGPEVPATEPA